MLARGRLVGRPFPPPAKPEALFSHYSMSADPELAADLPSVAFPKLSAASIKPGPTHPAALDSLYLSGFADHVDQTATASVTKAVGPFVALPGPGILPRVREELKKLEKLREKDLAENSNFTPRFAEEGGEGRSGGKGGDEAPERKHQALSGAERADLRRLERSLQPFVAKTDFERNMEVYKKVPALGWEGKPAGCFTNAST